MFTGIIEQTGTIHDIRNIGNDKQLLIQCPPGFLDDVALGDSIAISGVCLTVVHHDGACFAADVSNETISLTSLSGLSKGSLVNLEKAMQPQSRFGGHIVSGHVDGLGQVRAIAPDARSTRIDISLPKSISHYVAKKGSITVDGISLTVNAVSQDSFSINIIPHTNEKTTLSCTKVGDQVNLEVDMLARYVERILQKEHQEDESTHAKNATMQDLLARQGYL